MATIRDWAQLLRVPNTFTASSDALAGFSLIAGAAFPFTNFPIASVFIALSSISLYWAGMVLNDVLDVEVDRSKGRIGPLVDNRISWRTAAATGAILLLLGITFAGIATLTLPTPATTLAQRLGPIFVATVLATVILAYDWTFKRSAIAPFLMGMCRGLNLMLGMSLGILLVVPHKSDIDCACVVTIGQVLFVTGITIAARKEVDLSQSRTRLLWGWGCSAVGVMLMAFASTFATERQLTLDPRIIFPALVGLLMLPWARHAFTSIQTLSPKPLGAAIRQAILSILFLDAALTVQFAGKIPGLVVCSLIVPTLLLARSFRST